MHLTLVSLYSHLPRSADLALGMVTEATLMELFNGSLGEIFKSPTGQPPCVQVSMAGAINRGSGIVAHMMERTAALCFDRRVPQATASSLLLSSRLQRWRRLGCRSTG
jgi:hypothetical protein